MKRLVTMLSSFILVMPLFAQTNGGSCCLVKKDIVGIWQRNSDKVGNGLEQNFRFFEDGSFVLNLDSEGEDARGIFTLKGKYRLAKESLYLTILSRTVVEEGKIRIPSSNETLGLFLVEDGKVKEIKEVDPKEDPTPIYIA
ncbi:MAG TPA: hypothetical protein VGM41_07715, partial [Chitinophagaceae bacterium]